MLLNLKKPFLELTGVPVVDPTTAKDLLMSDVLAIGLTGPGNENVLLFYKFARDLVQIGEIDVTEKDIEILYSFVESHPTWPRSIKGQLLLELKNK
jgi:hypothetical protein